MKKVAIITRTKNRTITLERVLRSIHQQKFQDFIWVVVNDGGNKEAVNKIIKQALLMGVDATVIHNSISLGMEAASNIGIKNSESKYIVILDDDDTWHSDFLDRTVKFLDNRDNLLFKGVVTRTLVIEEEIVNNHIVFKKSYPFDPELKNITIFKIARCKSFPNLSFLYPRDAINKIGLYREDYPVIGDWDFNLRFIRHYNIAVIPEYLSNYHIRKIITKSDYDNSVSNKDNGKKYISLLRDELLRKEFDNNEINIGLLVNIGLELNEMERVVKRGSFLWVVRNIISRIYSKFQ